MARKSTKNPVKKPRKASGKKPITLYCDLISRAAIDAMDCGRFFARRLGKVSMPSQCRHVAREQRP